MTDIEKINLTWDNIKNNLYEQNEHFEYKKVKKIQKEIQQLQKRVQKRITYYQTTILLTEFNEKEEIQKEIQQTLIELIEFDKYLNKFSVINPQTPKGYYNYLKQGIANL